MSELSKIDPNWHHGFKVVYNDSEDNTAARCDHLKKEIQFNPDYIESISEEILYFSIRWCVYVDVIKTINKKYPINSINYSANALAVLDYANKGYNLAYLRYFVACQPLLEEQERIDRLAAISDMKDSFNL